MKNKYPFDLNLDHPLANGLVGAWFTNETGCAFAWNRALSPNEIKELSVDSYAVLKSKTEEKSNKPQERRAEIIRN